MKRRLFPRAFTLVEMLVVMVVIAILAGLVLSVNGLLQAKAARARASAEISALTLGCEAYKGDNGAYPRSSGAGGTDVLDARLTGTPDSYKEQSKLLYRELSGDLNFNLQKDSGEPNSYVTDLFKPQNLGGRKDSDGKLSVVEFIADPWYSSYGYSTIGAAQEEAAVAAGGVRPATTKGYNPTFDLWSTGGAPSGTPADRGKWITNWN